jgi:4'-phosphopantetheinyl transferase
VLSHYVPAVPAADWRFDRGELGRPSVARDMPEAARALHFNVAHTRGLVVMAVGAMPELGVDVERIDPGVRLAVARRYFSAPEVAALDSLPPEERPRRFQRLWTLKEAYLKAIGTGISGGLGVMSFHFEDGIRFEREDDAGAGSWQFREFEIGAEYLAAVAARPIEDAPLGVSLRDYPAHGA